MESAAAAKRSGFNPKQSQANKLWMLIIVVVLSVLFLEMKGNAPNNSNCCISTEPDDIGADVFIDKQKVGSIIKDVPGGLGGGVFRMMLHSGQHLIEIKKPDYKDYSKQVEMKKELYLEAHLSK